MDTLAEFEQFVMLSGGSVVTDSRRVAEKFGKRHAHVMRDIRRLLGDIGEEFAESNFGLCYENNELQNGKRQPFYTLTKDGFMFLVMGFTGRAAAKVKLAFLAAFNGMAEYIRDQAASDVRDFVHDVVALERGMQHASSCGKGLADWRKVRKPMLAKVEKGMAKLVVAEPEQLPIPFGVS